MEVLEPNVDEDKDDGKEEDTKIKE